MKKQKYNAITKTEAQLISFKNKARGALSRLSAKSTPEYARKAWHQEQIVRGQLNETLSQAKNTLSTRSYESFEVWVETLYSRRINPRAIIGGKPTSLGILPIDIKATSLESELRLAKERLRPHLGALDTFINKVNILLGQIRSREWENAKTELNKIEKEHGHSYWSVETELAIAQKIGGIDKLKTEVEALAVGATGLNKFLVYYMGVRNEPAQASARFKSMVSKKLDESDLPDVIQHYCKFRLYRNMDLNESSLAKILSVEKLTNIVDLYFTSTTITHAITQNKQNFSITQVVEAQELMNMLSAISIKLDEESTGVHHLHQEREQAALSLALRASEEWGGQESINCEIIQGIASRLSTRDAGVKAEEAAKLALNLSWLPEIAATGDLSSVCSLPQIFVDLTFKPSHEGRLVGPSINQKIAHLIFDQDALKSSLTYPAMREIGDGISLFLEQKETEAIQQLDVIETGFSTQPVALDCVRAVKARILYELDLYAHCLSICAIAGIDNERLIPALPLDQIFRGARWGSIRTIGITPDLIVCLDLYLKVIDDRKIRSIKRYALEELIKILNCEKISSLPTALQNIGVPIKTIEYLCYTAADLVTLELLPGMAASKKLLSARIDLLGSLASLNTRDEALYLREARDLTEKLQLEDVLNTLDDSKVYVDEAAILNAVNSELAADFQRYLGLVQKGIGVSVSINEVLRSFKNLSSKTFQIPKNDADDLLASMVDTILKRFLFDPAAGLDIIVGRRIRHGTIAGEIRGLLERMDLIGQKPSAGAQYALTQKASALCERAGPKQAKIIKAASNRFAEAIDGHIAVLRDEYFHVRSSKKTRGIFDVQLSSVLFAISRSIAQSCSTIDQFSSECVALLWFVLSSRLEAVRPTIEMEIKKTLNSISGKYASELKSLNINDPEFFAHLQRASEELQRNASNIASWVRVPNGVIDGKRTYHPIQRVIDVAVAVVTGQRPGFKPEIDASVPQNLKLDHHGFSIVEDALYIALDNVCLHSGIKIGNKVKIEISLDEGTSLLSFKIQNQVAAASKNSEREARINAIRTDIQRKAYGERARLDRGSGLSKLAALVMTSEKTSISFGFINPDLFELRFDLLYVSLIQQISTTQSKSSLVPTDIDSTLTH